MSKAHTFITEEMEKQIPKGGATANTPMNEMVLYVKLFTPDANWTWYISELDRENNIAFGYVQGLASEWGSFSLDELKEVKGALGLPIERDMHFKPTKFKDLRI